MNNQQTANWSPGSITDAFSSLNAAIALYPTVLDNYAKANGQRATSVLGFLTSYSNRMAETNVKGESGLQGRDVASMFVGLMSSADRTMRGTDNKINWDRTGTMQSSYAIQNLVISGVAGATSTYTLIDANAYNAAGTLSGMQEGHDYRLPDGTLTGGQYITATIPVGGINTTTPGAFIITFAPVNTADTLPSVVSGAGALYQGVRSFTGGDPTATSNTRGTVREYNVFQTTMMSEEFTSSANQYQKRPITDMGLYRDFALGMFPNMPQDQLSSVSGDNALAQPIIDFGLRCVEAINNSLAWGKRTQATVNGERRDACGGIQEACLQGGGILGYNPALNMVDTFIDFAKRLVVNLAACDCFLLFPGIDFQNKVAKDMVNFKAGIGGRFVENIDKNLLMYASNSIDDGLQMLARDAMGVYAWNKRNFTMMENFMSFDSTQEFGSVGYSRSSNAIMLPIERMNSSGISGGDAAPFQLLLPTNSGGDTKKYTLLDSRGTNQVNLMQPVVTGRNQNNTHTAKIKISVMSEYTMTFLGKDTMFQIEPN